MADDDRAARRAAANERMRQNWRKQMIDRLVGLEEEISEYEKRSTEDLVEIRGHIQALKDSLKSPSNT